MKHAVLAPVVDAYTHDGGTVTQEVLWILRPIDGAQDVVLGRVALMDLETAVSSARVLGFVPLKAPSALDLLRGRWDNRLQRLDASSAAEQDWFEGHPVQEDPDDEFVVHWEAVGQRVGLISRLMVARRFPAEVGELLNRYVRGERTPELARAIAEVEL